MNSKILMVIPTLGRPDRLSQCLQSLILNGTGKHDLYTIDGGRWFYDKANAIPPDLLAQYAVVGLMGNDCVMRTKEWDRLVMEKLSHRIGLLFGRDGIQNGHVPTAPFLSTRFCLEMGFIYPPGFHHYRGDRALGAIARQAGCLYYDPGLYTEHMHYCVRKSKLDSIYIKGRDEEPADEASWQRYLKSGLSDHVARAKAILAKSLNAA